MLQSIRDNSQGIIAKIIVGLIAITFALFGVESLVSLTGGSNAPATVNGEEISQQELYQGVQLQRRQLLSQMGEDADPTLLDENLISNMVLESLIEQQVLLQSAKNQGLVFSESMTDQLIVSSKEFQQDGRFDRAVFEAVLRNAGLTPLTYRALVEKDKVTEQERIAYLLSAFTLPSELEGIAKLDSQQRSIRYFTLPAAPVRNNVSVSDDEIAEFYDANRADYMTEEQVAIEYLLLDRTALEADINVTEDELENAYQVMVDNFQAQEQRHSAHILVEISDDQDDAAAKAKIEQIAEKITQGEDFAELAKTESSDLASAELGGDLGVNEKGVFTPEFEDALFALEKGQVSAPVRTEFGYHLIKLLDVVETDVPTFAEAKAELEADLKNQKSEEEYVVQLEQMADLAFSAGDLIEPAEALGLEIQKTAPFGRSGGEDEISANAKVLKVAFEAELINDGLNSTPVELDSGRAMVMRVAEHNLPREKELAEVSEQIKAQLIAEKVASQLADDAAALVAKLEQGEDFVSAAAANEVVTQDNLVRSNPDVAPELRIAVFKMPKPLAGDTFAAVDLQSGDKAIVALSSVTDAEVELQQDELKFMGMMLNNRAGQQDYQDHVNQLKAKAEVERL